MEGLLQSFFRCAYRSHSGASARSPRPFLPQAEEVIAVPACPGDVLCQLTEGSVDLILIVEAGGQHTDCEGGSAIRTFQNCACRRQAGIANRRSSETGRPVFAPEPAARTQPQGCFVG